MSDLEPKYKNSVQFLTQGSKIAGTAALATVLSEIALRRTNWSNAQKGAAAAGFGVVGSLLIAKRVPNVALGLLASGVVSGTKGVMAEVELRQYLAQSTAQRSNVTAPSGTAPSPGASSTSSGATAPAGALPSGQNRTRVYASVYDELMPVRR